MTEEVINEVKVDVNDIGGQYNYCASITLKSKTESVLVLIEMAKKLLKEIKVNKHD